MRCVCCNIELTDYELSFMINNKPIDTCMDCVTAMEVQVESDLTQASEADMPLRDEWTDD